MPTAPAAQQLSAVGFLLSYKYETDTHSRCVMLPIIEAMKYFVCVSVVVFAALAPVQMCQVILVCLLSWLKQHCDYLTTYIWARSPASELEVLVVLQPCTHVAHRRI